MSQVFQQIQRDFVSTIRSGVPVKGDPDYVRRMEIYQSLLFNNVLNFVETSFPVLRSIVEEDKWQSLVRDFFQHGKCTSPYFVAISEAFVTYLNKLDCQQYQLPPFTLSLAHYEWLELAISIRDAEVVFYNDTDKVNSVKLSPLADIVSYPYPVHQISPSYLPQEPSENNHFAVYRDRNNEVQFSKLTPATAFVLALLEENSGGLNFTQITTLAVEAMPTLNPDTIKTNLGATIAEMLKKDILLPA
ncbi:putative DNA-binding domain-containing protein [Alteromonas ponticola]|uniref:DNA-binding domain-containing protein n=1 Tax=Alteromonas aquimaris TaxID=2998417 RepID=A0ABT3P6H7_9ALTE|nr:putative DNA-binding domain-containing protein [Alteromonas aquimaris]MCW8108373.1 putative DNA-binding domain-containing protein [Alteromonas aquimaris]